MKVLGVFKITILCRQIFLFFSVNTRGQNCWVIWKVQIYLDENLQSYFPKQSYHLTFPPRDGTREHLGCSMSLPVFVLVYTPLVTSDFEHIVVCLLTICVFSFVKCLFKSFAHIFSFGLFVFLLNCIHFLCILDTSLLSDTCIANIFFLSLGSSLNFLKVIL